MRKYISCAAIFFGFVAQSQVTFPVNGAREKEWEYIALEHVTLHIHDMQIIEDATLLFHDGKIIAA